MDIEKVVEILLRHKDMTFGDKTYDGMQFTLKDIAELLQPKYTLKNGVGKTTCRVCGSVLSTVVHSIPD